MTTAEYDDALLRLRQVLSTATSDKAVARMLKSEPVVQARYKPIFSKQHLKKITKDEFWSFLTFEGNQHWTGLVRAASRVCADIPKLQQNLVVLLDETKPVAKRLDEVFRALPGMGRAIATAVLHVTHPAKYGVWNGTSENGMKLCKLWPAFDRGESAGKRYERINRLLLQVAKDLGVDLWTLDMLWWRVQVDTGNDASEPSPEAEDVVPGMAATMGFGLERHLHEFLRDNWDRTCLGTEWRLYSEEGNEEAGYEYPCGVGRIDLLVRGRRTKSWLVVELKRDQTSDTTVGQLLRYMGWVKHHLAASGETVQGLIIARAVDESLQYALTNVSNVDVQLYEVDFRLKRPDSKVGKQRKGKA